MIEKDILKVLINGRVIKRTYEQGRKEREAEFKIKLQEFKEAIAANVSEKRNIIELGKILHIMKEVFGEELTQSK